MGFVYQAPGYELQESWKARMKQQRLRGDARSRMAAGLRAGDHRRAGAAAAGPGRQAPHPKRRADPGPHRGLYRSPGHHRPGTVILPGTILRGKTHIGCGCTIGPNAMVRDCTVGDDTEIKASQINESTIGSRTHVGPSPMSAGLHHRRRHQGGRLVEVKNSTIGDGTKISHLTYVGDSDVGRRSISAAGTVTTNYDGFKKYRCTIGDRAFLGCNTNLIAPVTVGEGAYTAAGQHHHRRGPCRRAGSGRARQKNLEGWAAAAAQDPREPGAKTRALIYTVFPKNTKEKRKRKRAFGNDFPR